MRRILEQKWLTYLEVYGGHWTPRQAENAQIMFYAGATAFLQCMVLEALDNNEGTEPSEKEIERLHALRMEIEEFAARHRMRS